MSAAGRVVCAAVFAIAAVFAGCEVVDELPNFVENPDVGDPLQNLCVDEDSDPDVDVSFRADILEGIFQRAVLPCHDCHRPDAPTPIGFEVSGLDLTDRSTLLSGGVNSSFDIVVPGFPCESVIVQKVSEGPPFGSRMPFGGPPFLSAEEIRALSDWIAEGARDN